MGEYLTGFKEGVFQMDNLQHMTMYSFFLLYGLSQFLTATSFPLPANVDYFCMGMAYGVQLLLLFFHLHGKTHLNVHLHILLIVICFLALVGVFCEWHWKSAPLAALVRPFFTLVMGAWFWQIGFILWSPLPFAQPWKDHDHNETMLITALFCWHLFAGCLLFGVLFRTFARKANVKKVSFSTSHPDGRVDAYEDYLPLNLDESA